MASSHFFTKNFALIAGLGLPVLLVLGFLVANHLPQMNSAPPQYEMVFSVNRYNSQAPFLVNFTVRNKKLYMRLTPPTGSYGSNDVELFIYNGQKESVRKISYLPVIDRVIDSPVEMQVGELKHHLIDTNSKAPDGYELETNMAYSRGILGEIFGHRRNANRIMKSGGGSYVIPGYDNDYTYGKLNFIGWIVDSDIKHAD